jgi:hypothetical protein
VRRVEAPDRTRGGPRSHRVGEHHALPTEPHVEQLRRITTEFAHLDRVAADSVAHTAGNLDPGPVVAAQGVADADDEHPWAAAVTHGRR